MRAQFEEAMSSLERCFGPAAAFFRWEVAANFSGVFACGAAGLVGVLTYVGLAVAGRHSILPLVPAMMLLAMLTALFRGGGQPMP